jgi:hypothetical protein
MAQVGGVRVITWNPATGGASFHVLRGLVRALPAGPAGGDKLSLASRASGASTTDPDTPDPDEAFWYLIRESATCP